MISANPSPAPTRLSVAIVDDEAPVRVGLCRLCRALGLQATTYASGMELLEALEGAARIPDCLLLDAHMPQMSGLEVQQQLVRRGLRFPTLMYSADDAPEALDRYIAAGAVAFLRKPVTADLLVAAIERAVAGRA